MLLENLPRRLAKAFFPSTTGSPPFLGLRFAPRRNLIMTHDYKYCVRSGFSIMSGILQGDDELFPFVIESTMAFGPRSHRVSDKKEPSVLAYSRGIRGRIGRADYTYIAFIDAEFGQKNHPNL